MVSESTKTSATGTNDFGLSTLHEAEVLMNGEHVLTPRMVSSLLNVSVLLDNEHVHTEEVTTESSPIMNAVLIAVLAVVIAAASGAALLYINEIGPFNKPTATAAVSST
jgi:hypothetical protein